MRFSKAGTSHSTAWTALPKDRHFVMWHKPFCADLRSDTFAALCGLLGSFGTEWATGPASPQPPFASWLEQQDLVSCVLRLLCCHVTLAADSSSRGGGGNPHVRKEDTRLLREGERRRLEAVLYSLVNLQCPSDVLDLIHACLNKGANLLLPDLETRLGQLATLLQAKELNNGQELNLKLLLQSLDDPAVVAELLASPAQECPAKDELEVKAFAVLKTLIVRTFRHFVS